MAVIKTPVPVLHIRDSGGLFGAEQVILTIGHAIDRRRFLPILLSIERGTGTGIAFAQWCRTFGWEAGTLRVRGKADYLAVKQLRGFIHKNSVAIVHAHDFKSELYAVLGSMGTGARRVVTSHGSTKDSPGLRLSLALSEYVLYPFFHKIVAVSRARQQSLLTNPMIGRRSIELIENGFDYTLFKELSNRQMDPDDISVPAHVRRIGIAGRLLPDKNHALLFKAFAASLSVLPESLILVVGDGPNRHYLEQLARSLAIAHKVNFCGLRRDMASVYEKLDVLVIPSLREGLPYVLLESMACGVPVIASAVGGIPDLIRHNETGLLIEPTDERQLAEALVTVFKDPDNARRMARNARELVTRRYSHESMIRRTEHLYEMLVTTGHGAGR